MVNNPDEPVFCAEHYGSRPNRPRLDWRCFARGCGIHLGPEHLGRDCRWDFGFSGIVRSRPRVVLSARLRDQNQDLMEPGATAVIVPAGRDDLPAIARLAGIIWRAHYPGIISAEQIDYMLGWMYNREALEKELIGGTSFDQLFVGKQLIGFGSYGKETETEMKLHKLYVDPAWQRRGFGRRLLAHVEEAARGRGFSKLVLGVNKRNEKAIAAYHKHGYSIRESIVTRIGGGFVMDDFIMEKTLASPEQSANIPFR
jgi:ribosomal protein S18 acetylase RimI-like enzyme